MVNVTCSDQKIAGLETGESEAIHLARELGADLLLTDDRRARREAIRLGVSIATTLTVLGAAADFGYISFEGAVRRLRETNFRVDPRILDALLNERKDASTE